MDLSSFSHLSFTGDKFDVREFHEVVLHLGRSPLTVVEKAVDKYIQQYLKKPNKNSSERPVYNNLALFLSVVAIKCLLL